MRWCDAVTKLWHIPIIVVVRNNNTNTVIVNLPPTKFLPKCPPPTDTIHNVYELKIIPHKIHLGQGHQEQTVCLVAGSHS